MSDQKNLILAMVLSVAILIGFDYLYVQPRMEAQRAQQAAQELVQQTPAPGNEAGTAAIPRPDAAAQITGPRERAELIADLPRLRVDNGRLHGSLSPRGGRIDDLTLADYYETVERKTEVVLFSPAGAANAYFAEFGWVSADGAERALPGRDTDWQGANGQLTATAPIEKTWDNGAGLRFTRTVALDADFMFTVTDTVTNSTEAAVALHPYALVARDGAPPTSNVAILHEGPIGVLDGQLREVKYKKLTEEGEAGWASTGGWLGITDKYWLAALIPDQSEAIKTRFLHTPAAPGRDERYQADYLGTARQIAPGASISVTHRLFAGAKEVNLLDSYAKQLALPNFDKAVDFGMFYFLTRPFFAALDYIGRMVGNFGVAILIFTGILRFVMFPLANKSFIELNRMKDLQPQMKELQERYADDREKMQKSLMELYQKEKVNPLAGCVPILLQIPIFYALYKVLFVTIEMRHAPFFGWITDLSAPDPTSLFNLFGLIPWSPPSFLMIGVWPLVMGVTMFLQQKLNPAPADPMQAKVMMFLPFVFTFMLASFPAGLVIYWAWSNLLSIGQQWLLKKRMERAKLPAKT